MSISSVMDYVQGRCATVANPTGANAATLRCIQGIPHSGLPADIGQFPLCVLTFREFTPETQTAGASGTVWEKYAVVISLYLGPMDMAHADALAWARVFPQRFRAVFAPDWKLGGNCLNCDLRGPADNLQLNLAGQAQYQQTQQYPILQWALMVTENAVANAAAS